VLSIPLSLRPEFIAVEVHEPFSAGEGFGDTDPGYVVTGMIVANVYLSPVVCCEFHTSVRSVNIVHESEVAESCVESVPEMADVVVGVIEAAEEVVALEVHL